MRGFHHVAVIGAGVMGAGIAAHFANAGLKVELLDFEGVAEGALKKMLKANPAPFMHKRFAKSVRPGDIDKDFDRLADCDWIVEAVIEKLEIKQDLYGRIEAVRKEGSVVSSNTSTLPLALLTRGMPERFRRDFLITHFFNPPRYMRLLEIVTGAEARTGLAESVTAFADRALGKGVVHCKDTPGFVANRIGIYWLQCAVTEAVEGGLSVEETDAVVGRPMGIPKTGVFGLLDLVGIDLMPHTLGSMALALPEDDGFHAVWREPVLARQMIAEGYTGRKGKGGFYRLNRDGGRKVKEARNLETGAYAKAAKPMLESLQASKAFGLRGLVSHPDAGGVYAWKVLSGTLCYAASLVPEIADDFVDVDTAMRLGYGWKWGPFELLDRLGPKWFADRLRAEGRAVPALIEAVGEGSFYRRDNGDLLRFDGSVIERPEGVLLLADVKRRTEPLAKNGSASLWDIGEGVLCLEFHSKMNAIDAGTIAMIERAIKMSPGALVIHNEAENFSVGANLGMALFAANIAAWPEIDGLIAAGQKAYQALRYAPFPVVGAPAGMALGGGCEILLHCDAVQAAAETYMGLVEVGVGIVPGWGGCAAMLRRWARHPRRPGGPMPPVIKSFETIGLASVAKSAAEAFDHAYLLPGVDRITPNRERLLADAKARALELAEDYHPPEPGVLSLPGATARTAMTMALHDLRKSGKATPHDAVVAGWLAKVLSGGDGVDATEPVPEERVLELEREAVSALFRHPATLARMEHMLETGKPLRN